MDTPRSWTSKDCVVKELYGTKLKNRFEALGNTIEESSLDDALDIINGMIKKTAEEVIGFRRHKRAPWLTNNILALDDECRDLGKKMNNSPGDMFLKQRCSQLKTNIDNKVVKCCDNWFNKQCCEAESRKNDMQKVKMLKKGVKINERCGNIRNKDGNLLTKDTDILSRWYEYGSGIYNASIEAYDDILEQLWPNCRRDVHEQYLLESKKQPSPRLNPGPQMAEEQAVFRPGRGTIEQIDLLRLIVEKYLALQDK